jgi:arylsulfatase A-like enzyme
MSVLQRFPRLNDRWMELKHRVGHRLARRDRTFDRSLAVSDPRPVVVVVVDCLRADHVSGFGYDRPTTPTIDSLDAAAFPNAKTPAPWTFPAVPSLLSGRYPHRHGARFESDPRNLAESQFPAKPAADVPMLPDLLAAAGYETALITAIPMAERAVGDRFQSVSVTYGDATERVASAVEWLDGRSRPFLYLHLGDPHAPLDVPDEYREAFAVPDVAGLADWRFRESTDGDGFETYRDARVRAYDAAVRGADDALSRLVAALPDDALLVVCGDHGEAFWEHPDLERELNDDPRGYYATDHGHSVLGEVTDVPLWVRAPGVRGSDDPVSLVDVAPTVLSALGGGPTVETDGVALQRGDRDGPLLCEETAYGYDQRAVWLDGVKGVLVPETGRAVTFAASDDAETDPSPGLTADLRRALDSFDGQGRVGDEEMDVDEATRERLSELGYLE